MKWHSQLKWLASMAIAGTMSLGMLVTTVQADSSNATGNATGNATSTNATSDTAPKNVLGTPASVQQTLTLSTPYPTVLRRVSFHVSGLSANATYHVVWETFQGEWDTNGNTFVGQSYTPGVTTLAQVSSDATGHVTGSFVVPSGYGDIHQIGLVDQQGQVVAQGSVTVKPSVHIQQTVEPEGQFFTVTMKGIGYGAYSALYQVMYDNRLTGNVTAVTTHGTATFQVRAEGVGQHQIEIDPSSIGLPYLNEQQSPYSWKPSFDIPVTVTKGHPQRVQDALPTPTPSVGTNLTAAPGQGIVGSHFTLSGKGLGSDENVTIEWSNTVGNHVTAAGFHTTMSTLGHVTTNGMGDFSKTMTVPQNVGGLPHVIQVVDSRGNVVGSTTFQIEPSLVSAPKTVQLGHLFTVHLQGGGPDTYDNVYTVLYDNSAIGYACGFNSNGDMQIEIRATGAPGIHYVDLYPTIQQGNERVPNVYLLPMLTYQKDHPGLWQPAYHLVIRVTS